MKQEHEKHDRRNQQEVQWEGLKGPGVKSQHRLDWIQVHYNQFRKGQVNIATQETELHKIKASPINETFWWQTKVSNFSQTESY